MPSSTPLYNIKLQSSLDFNNQALNNNNASKAYTLKGVTGTSKTIDVSDMGRTLVFEGSTPTLTINNSIAGVTAGDSFIVTTASGGLTVSGSATQLGVENLTYSTWNLYQFICRSSTSWIVINSN